MVERRSWYSFFPLRSKGPLEHHIFSRNGGVQTKAETTTAACLFKYHAPNVLHQVVVFLQLHNFSCVLSKVTLYGGQDGLV
jgi:hypothetical protein